MIFKNRIISKVLFLLFLVFQLIPLKLHGTELSKIREDINNLLLSGGAKKINSDKTTDEYLMNEFRTCVINYDIDLCSISSIDVCSYCENEGEHDKETYISLTEFKEFINYFDKIHPLGEYIGNSPIIVIPKAGWRNYTKIYKNARVTKREEKCEDFEPNFGCPIEWFVIKYWMNLSGKVKSKYIDEIKIFGPNDTPIHEYILNISGKRVVVTKKIYNKIKTGDIVSFQVITKYNRYLTKQLLEDGKTDD